MNANYGVTLMELLIAMAIVLLLSTGGYVAYQHHVIQSYRHQAKITLVELATQLEQHHISYGTYPATLDNFPIGSHLNRRYQFTVESVSKFSYQLLAEPINQQVNDTQCGILGYDQLGVKTTSGSSSSQTCWGNIYQ